MHPCCHHIATLITLGFLGVSLFAVGIATPWIVRHVQDEGLMNALRIPEGQGDYTDQEYDEFLNPFIYRDYYVYNYTNVRGALLNGDKLDVVEVGPIHFQRYQHRFDVTYPEINGTKAMQFLYWTEYIYRSDITQTLTMNEEIITSNAFYIGAIGAAGSESLALASALPTTLGVIDANYRARNNSHATNLLRALRFRSLRFYTLYIPNHIRDVCNGSSFCTSLYNCSNASLHIAQEQTFCGYTSALYAHFANSSAPTLKSLLPNGNKLGGFEWGAARVAAGVHGVSLNATQAEGLLSPDKLFGLGNPQGFFSWSAIVQTNCFLEQISDACNASTSAGGSARFVRERMDQIFASTDYRYLFTTVTWFTLLGVLTDLTGGATSGQRSTNDYTELTMEFWRESTVASNAGIEMTQWVDLCMFQYATGYPFGMTVGFGATAAQRRDFFEFNIGAIAEPWRYMQILRATGRVDSTYTDAIADWTIPEAISFLIDFTSSASMGAAFIGFSTNFLIGSGAPNPDYTFSTPLSAMVNGVLSPAFSTRFDGFVASEAPFLVGRFGGLRADRSNWAFMHYLIRDLYGLAFTQRGQVVGSSSTITADGTNVPINGIRASGIFIRVTILEFLNGYNDTLTTLLGTPYSGAISVITRSYKGASDSPPVVEEDQRNEIRQDFGVDRFWTINRGQEDWKQSAQYIEYEGVASFQTWAELYKSLCFGGRAAFCANLGRQNDPAWNERETITGLWTGERSDPFQDPEHNGANDFFNIWFPEGNRHLLLRFTESKEVKDIMGNKYVVDDAVFGYNRNASDLWGPRYFSDGHPLGLVSISTTIFNIPIVLHEPAFSSNVGGEAASTINMVNFAPDRERFSSEVIIEPWSGVTISATQKIGASWDVSDRVFDDPYNRNLFVRNTTIYLPYYWLDDHKDIEDDDARDFVNIVYRPREAGLALAVVLPIVGVSLIAFVIYLRTTSSNAHATNKNQMTKVPQTSV